MAVTIEVENRQKKIPLNPSQIRRLAKKILQFENVRSVHLSVALVTDHQMRALNQKFLGRRYSTDVLAFDLTPRNFSRTARRKVPIVNGEIIICPDVAGQNAKKFKTSTEQEVILYLAHGILHLLGYDDHTEKDRREIRQKEQELLQRLGI